MLLFCALLACGALLPVAPSATTPITEPVASGCRAGARTTTAVTVVGIMAFAAGRVLAGGHAPFAVGGYAILTSSLAAVAEEAFFRRLCFGLLQPAGAVFAIGGSSILFALVHVATYGWWVLPVDLAAGALLGWQRWISGSWAAPAVTHVIANLLVLL
jgi:membrane protease YdiL (CAAX protease family)